MVTERLNSSNLGAGLLKLCSSTNNTLPSNAKGMQHSFGTWLDPLTPVILAVWVAQKVVARGSNLEKYRRIREICSTCPIPHLSGVGLLAVSHYLSFVNPR